MIGLPAVGARTGVSCPLCHVTTDASLLGLPGRGSIGRRRDGPANALDFGGLVALGDRSLAYAPALRLALGQEATTEAEVDALLLGAGFHPRRPRVGEQAADFSGDVYTTLLDPTGASTRVEQAGLDDLAAYLAGWTRGAQAAHPFLLGR